jgi:osmotically inducible protein OsmC
MTFDRGRSIARNDEGENAMADRTATVTWKGSLTEGQGLIDTGSGVLKASPVTWASRVETPEGKTSPEELLAASEAECYAMVLANMLTQAGTTPERLTVAATCTVERIEGGLKITTMRLDVRGRVDGVDAETFARTAQEAEAACPVSNALRGNLEISVEARLER